MELSILTDALSGGALRDAIYQLWSQLPRALDDTLPKDAWHRFYASLGRLFLPPIQGTQLPTAWIANDWNRWLGTDATRCSYLSFIVQIKELLDITCLGATDVNKAAHIRYLGTRLAGLDRVDCEYDATVGVPRVWAAGHVNWPNDSPAHITDSLFSVLAQARLAGVLPQASHGRGQAPPDTLDATHASPRGPPPVSEFECALRRYTTQGGDDGTLTGVFLPPSLTRDPTSARNLRECMDALLPQSDLFVFASDARALPSRILITSRVRSTATTVAVYLAKLLGARYLEPSVVLRSAIVAYLADVEEAKAAAAAARARARAEREAEAAAAASEAPPASDGGDDTATGTKPDSASSSDGVDAGASGSGEDDDADSAGTSSLFSLFARVREAAVTHAQPSYEEFLRFTPLTKVGQEALGHLRTATPAALTTATDTPVNLSDDVTKGPGVGMQDYLCADTDLTAVVPQELVMEAMVCALLDAHTHDAAYILDGWLTNDAVHSAVCARLRAAANDARASADVLRGAFIRLFVNASAGREEPSTSPSSPRTGSPRGLGSDAASASGDGSDSARPVSSKSHVRFAEGTKVGIEPETRGGKNIAKSKGVSFTEETSGGGGSGAGASETEEEHAAPAFDAVAAALEKARLQTKTTARLAHTRDKRAQLLAAITALNHIAALESIDAIAGLLPQHVVCLQSESDDASSAPSASVTDTSAATATPRYITYTVGPALVRDVRVPPPPTAPAPGDDEPPVEEEGATPAAPPLPTPVSDAHMRPLVDSDLALPAPPSPPSSGSEDALAAEAADAEMETLGDVPAGLAIGRVFLQVCSDLPAVVAAPTSRVRATVALTALATSHSDTAVAAHTDTSGSDGIPSAIEFVPRDATFRQSTIARVRGSQPTDELLREVVMRLGGGLTPPLAGGALSVQPPPARWLQLPQELDASATASAGERSLDTDDRADDRLRYLLHEDIPRTVTVSLVLADISATHTKLPPPPPPPPAAAVTTITEAGVSGDSAAVHGGDADVSDTAGDGGDGAPTDGAADTAPEEGEVDADGAAAGEATAEAEGGDGDAAVESEVPLATTVELAVEDSAAPTHDTPDDAEADHSGEGEGGEDEGDDGGDGASSHDIDASGDADAQLVEGEVDVSVTPVPVDDTPDDTADDGGATTEDTPPPPPPPPARPPPPPPKFDFALKWRRLASFTMPVASQLDAALHYTPTAQLAVLHRAQAAAGDEGAGGGGGGEEGEAPTLHSIINTPCWLSDNNVSIACFRFLFFST